MRRLVGGTHFLVLRRKDGFSGHSVAIKRRFDDAMREWRAGDRVSPIFPLQSAQEPSLESGISWALFFGPYDPGQLPPQVPGSLFLTVGQFNLVIFSAEESARADAQQLAGQLGVAWEEWKLAGADLTGFRCSPEVHDRRASSETTEPLAAPVDVALTPALREYRALMATCASRSESLPPETKQELLSFNRILRARLVEPGDSVVKLGALITANASLSRFSSQLLSGLSPILETESHFWPHSLLGIGVAVLAVNRLRRFLETVLVNARFGDRFLCLEGFPPHTRPLHSTMASDPFWDTDPLFAESDEMEAALARMAAVTDHLPLITFFSARDGFRNTDLSLSVPLEVVSSCNATHWTLHTLTHEISHTVINLILARLLPKPHDETALGVAPQAVEIRMS